MESATPKIGCIGEVMIELVPQTEDMAHIGVAGDTYNSAIYLQRELKDRAEVSYVTALGQDGFSDQILAHMRSNNIGTNYVERRRDQVPGLYAIQTDTSGERSFTYWRSESAARTLFQHPAQITFDALSDFKLILLTGITLAILPVETRERLMQEIDHLRGQGVKVAFDSNYRPGLWQSRAEAQDVIERMWHRTDIALPSADDEMALFRDLDANHVRDRLRRWGCRQGVLKQGSLGPMSLGDIALPDTSFSAANKVIDTTAAGDSFNAGYLAAILQGRSEAQAMQSAHDLSCHVIKHRGAIVPVKNN